jgi:hypothetical protein
MWLSYLQRIAIVVVRLVGLSVWQLKFAGSTFYPARQSVSHTIPELAFVQKITQLSKPSKTLDIEIK